MKRTVLFLSILGAAALLGAQEQPGRDRTGPEPRNGAAEAVTLSGTLGLEQGRIVLKSGEDGYFVAGIRPLAGFVEGLKEGAAVTIEGTVLPARGNGGYGLLYARKLSLGGKDYELPRHPRPDFRTADAGKPDRNGQPGGNGGPGWCGHRGWGSPGRDKTRGRFGERGPERYRGGRHGRPARPGARSREPFSGL
jgi:hypothetical protein